MRYLLTKIPLRLLLVLGLIAVHFALGLFCIQSKCASFDEPVFLTGGYYYNLKSDFRVNSEGGVLSQRLAALPAYYLPEIKLPEKTYGDLPNHIQYEIANSLISSDPNYDNRLNHSRLLILLLSCVLAALLYHIAAQIFGRSGGLISLSLYCFCPLVLSNATFVTADLCSSAFFLVATYFIWQLFRRISLANFILTTIGISGVILAKMSGLMIVPIYVLLLAAASCLSYNLRIGGHSISRSGKRLAVLAGITFAGALSVYLLIWAAYDFRSLAYGHCNSTDRIWIDRFWDVQMEKNRYRTALEFTRQKQLLPEAFLFGLAFTTNHTVRPNLMNGVRRATGSLFFFPYALSIKNSLPEIILILGGIGSGIFFAFRAKNEFARQRWRRIGFLLLPFVALLTIYLGIAMVQKLNIGIRHLLPVYPTLFLFAGALGEWFRRRNKSGIVIIVALLCGMIYSNISIAPHYNSYFNSLVGGPKNGWKCLADSSLDWGQDLPALNKKLGKTQEKVYLSYFGGPYLWPEKYLSVKFDYMAVFVSTKNNRISLELSPGIYCISATRIWNVYDYRTNNNPEESREYYQKLCRNIQEIKDAANHPKAMESLAVRGEEYWSTVFRDFDRLRYYRLCQYLRQRQPDDYAGYSILIFRLSKEELSAAIAP